MYTKEIRFTLSYSFIIIMVIIPKLHILQQGHVFIKKMYVRVLYHILHFETHAFIQHAHLNIAPIFSYNKAQTIHANASSK